MVARSHEKAPLTATISERIYAAPEIAVIRRRPIPVAPALAVVPTPEPSKEPEPVTKKTVKRTRHTPEFKRAVVARILEGRESGKELITDVEAALGLVVGTGSRFIRQLKATGKTLEQWQKNAPKKNGAAPIKNAPKSAVKATSNTTDNITSLSRELTEALERVEGLKKRMRALLD